MTATMLKTSNTTRRRLSERSIAGLLGGGLVVGLILLWQIAGSAGWVNTFLTSSPSLVLEALWEQITSGELAEALRISGMEFAIGFGAAVVIGVSVGLLMGRYRYVEYGLDPFVWLIYSSPTIALFPLIMVVVGLGSPTVIVITFLLSVIPIVINAAQGVRNTDKDLVRAAISFGASESTLLRKIILPASVPTIMAGIRLGIGRALVGVIVGEFFAGTAGIGYNVSYYAGRLQTSSVMASVVVAVVAGLLINALAKRLERVADSWRTDVD